MLMSELGPHAAPPSAHDLIWLCLPSASGARRDQRQTRSRQRAEARQRPPAELLERCQPPFRARTWYRL